MDATSAILLVAIVLVVALITYVVWRNPKVKTSVGLGPIRINLNTERTTEHAERKEPTSPKAAMHGTRSAARLSVRNVQHSSVTNIGAGGGAEMKAGDVAHSTIVNTAGRAALTDRGKDGV